MSASSWASLSASGSSSGARSCTPSRSEWNNLPARATNSAQWVFLVYSAQFGPIRQWLGDTTMAAMHDTSIGRLAAIWRYPVKSMLGEELIATELTERGLRCDRAYALIDVETGKVVSAKNPRRWPNLFDFRAACGEFQTDDRSLQSVQITLPDGASIRSDHAGVDERLSAAVGRPVRLARTAAERATAEGYWPDHDWL